MHQEPRRIAGYIQLTVKLVQISSDVYEFDICLSRLQKLNQISAQCYRDFGKRMGNNRPPLVAYTSVLDLKDSKKELSGGLIQDIEIRWKQFSFLRGLYVDNLISDEFEISRAYFDSEVLWDARESVKKITDASIQRSHFNHSQFEQNRHFGPEFKARFHRSLCLHSMAILGLRFGKASRDQPLDHGVRPTNESQKVAADVKDSIGDLWRKKSVIAGGKTTVLNGDTKIECLEVSDFLYPFLLKKIVPYERLASWTRGNAGDYPYRWIIEDMGGEDPFTIEERYDFLSYCCGVLEPHDLAELIDNRAWVGDDTYPPDKGMYMQIRGMFDGEGPGDAGWDISFSRTGMMRELQYDAMFEKAGAREIFQWDELRLRLGSPFLPDAMLKYSAETSSRNILLKSSS